MGFLKSRRALALIIVIALGLILICALGLYFTVLSSPRLARVEPPDGAVDVAPTSPITLTFSTSMDRAATEGAVKISPQVAGEMSWADENTLVFTPQTRMPLSTTVQVSVSSAARSRLFGRLDEQSASSFTTVAAPAVIGSAPAPGARYAYVPNALTLTFNRAMDHASVEEALTVTPPLAVPRYEWRGNTLILFGGFEPLTPYQIKLRQTARDEQFGIGLEREYTRSFTTTEQYPQFSILQLPRYITLRPNQANLLPTQLADVSRLDAELYWIDKDVFLNNLVADFESWEAFQPDTPPLKSWSAQPNAAIDQYTPFDLPMDALKPGWYYLNVTAPEGVSDRKLVVVTGLALDISRAGDQLTVQAKTLDDQKPAANVMLEIYDEKGNKLGEGKTDAQGKFSTLLACGDHDGVICVDELTIIGTRGEEVAAARGIGN